MTPKGISMILVSLLMLASCTGNANMEFGVKNGSLSPCPHSPNCVSSQSSDENHYFEPIKYSGTPAQAREKLISVIRSMKRSRIVESHDDYIHAEFTSVLFRFVDDAEFYFPPGDPIIQARSASRIGYYDFGVNRRRMERIRHEFEK